MVLGWFRVAMVVALALGLAACGSDEDHSDLTIAGAETCEQFADAYIAHVQEVLDELSSMSMDELMSADEEPEVLGSLDDRIAESAEKSAELGCDDQMEELFAERADQLTADGLIGEMMLSVMREQLQ